jgi:hypothetical protein
MGGSLPKAVYQAYKAGLFTAGLRSNRGGCLIDGCLDLDPLCLIAGVEPLMKVSDHSGAPPGCVSRRQAEQASR